MVLSQAEWVNPRFDNHINEKSGEKRISRDIPKVRTIILSMHTSEEYVSRAMRSGASGYVLKGADIDELEYAIRKVFNGKTYLIEIRDNLGYNIYMSLLQKSKKADYVMVSLSNHAMKSITYIHPSTGSG